MSKKWNELTEQEQWQQAKAERAIRHRAEHDLEVAHEEFEDGNTGAVRAIESNIKAAVNSLRRANGIEEL